MLTRAIKGVKDILPKDVTRWRKIESVARGLFDAYGFSEIRTPIIEHTVLFARSIGATSDIVEKEMYAFTDTGGDEITLRPEGTAGVVRSYVEHKLYAKGPLSKLYYMGPMFRRENPQAGRFRQFHQVGAESIGSGEPAIDVEALALLSDFFEALGIVGVELQVNSLGCRDCRPSYRDALRDFLEKRRGSLCENCQRRIGANPLRALDCKSKKCRAATADAPEMPEFLDDACRAHFDAVRQGLEELGIPYAVNPRMVRGLDYYTRTAFEMVETARSGAQNAVAAGGRYDGLVEELGGPGTPGIGFAVGMERLLALFPEDAGGKDGPELFVAALGDEAGRIARKLVHSLRKKSVHAEWDHKGSSLKSQMKKADRHGAKRVLIIGDDEVAKGEGMLRDMKTGQQEDLALQDAAGRLLRLLG